jgi:hypothetical protein
VATITHRDRRRAVHAAARRGNRKPKESRMMPNLERPDGHNPARTAVGVRSPAARLLLITSAAMALAACGGGSGAATAPAANAYDFEAAFVQETQHGLTASGTFTVTSNGTVYTGPGTVTVSPQTATSFNGSAAYQLDLVIAGNVSGGGASGKVSGGYSTYLTGDHRIIGRTDPGEFDIAQSPMTYPGVVAAGESGPLGTLLRYTDSTMSIPIGSDDVSYGVMADPNTPSTLIVGIAEQVMDSFGSVEVQASYQYALPAGGGMTLRSLSIHSISLATDIAFAAQ